MWQAWAKIVKKSWLLPRAVGISAGESYKKQGQAEFGLPLVIQKASELVSCTGLVLRQEKGKWGLNFKTQFWMSILFCFQPTIVFREFCFRVWLLISMTESFIFHQSDQCTFISHSLHAKPSFKGWSQDKGKYEVSQGFGAYIFQWQQIIL